ncbi:hypothetical protein EVB94_209 [Rhizobium phage RHph_TM40]|uniref:Uncharacterized protein n=2 Tax=Cuauhnahuacvirus TaxID=3044696 RepID=A0A7S5UWV8_9CAUD|nr:hypothetical protein PQC16_gp210 [Rhizobium phage RHph_TM30]YP_010671359.1 hypothetical protein PQC17_gp210 [Rhizobium phage RHph_Y65]QIG71680.1 hypothetical protein EVB94_209 [Rhizobium phage RHph_TM40]QIG72043.1 hypothetical protein EVB95_209 [Rhizobium phage RHph_TM2_3B]QIG77508.1 hypothetical protein EVB61_180 [Rhizobium phage RHph_TM21B]QIG77796.1 hypothetical protein EVB64_209 [Rhizobium phage RHph_TM61]QIG71317.1 hypothetical protein EVB93_210 [Rhizobium phage RHph_TM30]
MNKLDYCHDCARAHLQSVVERIAIKKNLKLEVINAGIPWQTFIVMNRDSQYWVQIDMKIDQISYHDIKEDLMFSYVDLDATLSEILK